MQNLLRYYHIDDHHTELVSINTFYSNEVEYDLMVQANFMDF